MPILPLAGALLWYRHRKSWLDSSALGVLKEDTLHPCGLTPLKTCLMVPSLPPVSMACSTMSSPRSFSAYSRA